ncbi:MAG: hypothetical protein IT479_08375 [Xanthomonadales bacterium]|nr:hypothetical protein [Xanthomonadales bacterium]MCC6593277.1 hypothetical protein [Xanthomonadales bacterium]MCE7930914.1 hypothetical protein [Xanthomonadales bacterium PRO6]
MLRLLFTSSGGWRAGFDLVQAAAALDLPLEIGFAGDGLRLILVADGGQCPASFGAFASLELLGVDRARVPAPAPAQSAALPLQALAPAEWRDWLRSRALQTW